MGTSPSPFWGSPAHGVGTNLRTARTHLPSQVPTCKQGDYITSARVPCHASQMFLVAPNYQWLLHTRHVEGQHVHKVDI